MNRKRQLAVLVGAVLIAALILPRRRGRESYVADAVSLRQAECPNQSGKAVCPACAPSKNAL